MEKRPLAFEESRQNVEEYLAFIKANPLPFGLLLDGLDNQRNIASIFRIADAARIERIYTWQMPSPEESIKMRRISRNTLNLVNHQSIDTKEELAGLQEEWRIVALEITNYSIPVREFTPKEKTLLVIGNEKKGVSPELLQICPEAIHIPMYGLNTSMNVAVATGIALFGLIDQLDSDIPLLKS